MPPNWTFADADPQEPDVCGLRNRDRQLAREGSENGHRFTSRGALLLECGPKASKVRKRPSSDFRFTYDSAHEEYESELAGLFAGEIVAGRTV
jgi:hypothetical protein